MEKKVTNCGECPFKNYQLDGFFYCGHPDSLINEELTNFSILHPSCPEGQPFVIITSKIKEDE